MARSDRKIQRLEIDLIGYKVIPSDMTSFGITYKVGEIYEINGSKIIPDKEGLYFCKNLDECYHFMDNSNNSNVVLEVETLNDSLILELPGCLVTNRYKINKIVLLQEILDYFKSNRKVVNWEIILESQYLPTDFMMEFREELML